MTENPTQSNPLVSLHFRLTGASVLAVLLWPLHCDTELLGHDSHMAGVADMWLWEFVNICLGQTKLGD